MKLYFIGLPALVYYQPGLRSNQQKVKFIFIHIMMTQFHALIRFTRSVFNMKNSAQRLVSFSIRWLGFKTIA